MILPLQITSRNLELTEPIKADIHEHAEKLDKYYNHIMSCRVAVEAMPNRSLYNVRIFEMEENIQVTLYDFNNSSIFDGVPLSTEHENVGSPEYTAPEIWDKEFFDHRADLYSFGIVAYAMLTGACPYQSEEENLLDLVEDLREQHLYNPISSARAENLSLSDDVDWFFERALAKIPEERFQTAKEFNRDFQKLL